MRVAVTPTIGRFLQSEAFLCLLEGPRREGKTWGALLKPLYEAERQQLQPEHLPLRVLAIRDTWTNLERSVIASLEEMARQGLRVVWQDGRTAALVGGGRVKLHLMGVDRPENINKLQGLGMACLYLEEPAPAADISGGIPPEVLGVGITSLSQPHIRPWVQVAMNPPDEDHWICNVSATLQASLATSPLLRDRITVEHFDIPPGERVSAEDRERNKLVLYAIGRGDLVQRLVEGRRGQIVQGQPVCPDFDERLHVAPGPIPILPGVPIVRSWDFGLTPACVVSQVAPTGRFHVLAALTGEGIGLEQFLESHVKPWQSQYLGDGAWSFRDIHDPAGTMREQSNSDCSAVQTLIDVLDAHPEPGPVEWAERRDSLNALLGRQIRGRGVLQIDPECKALIRALRGGAHYPKDGLGRVTPTVEAYKRASGLFSHPFDALGYAVATLFPLHDQLVKRAGRAKPPVVRRPLATHTWMGA